MASISKHSHMMGLQYASTFRAARRPYVTRFATRAQESDCEVLPLVKSQMHDVFMPCERSVDYMSPSRVLIQNSSLSLLHYPCDEVSPCSIIL